MPVCFPPHVTPKWQSPQSPVVKSRGMLRSFEFASRLCDKNKICAHLGHYAVYDRKSCVTSSRAQTSYTSRQKPQITRVLSLISYYVPTSLKTMKLPVGHTFYNTILVLNSFKLIFPCIATLYTIIQQDAAVRSQFYFTATLLYMFRVLSTPIIRSTLTVYTAPGTDHISVQLPSSNVATLEEGSAPMYDLYRRL